MKEKLAVLYRRCGDEEEAYHLLCELTAADPQGEGLWEELLSLLLSWRVVGSEGLDKVGLSMDGVCVCVRACVHMCVMYMYHHCIVLYCIVLYCFVLYCIVLYCIVLYCIVLYCIVLYVWCILSTLY